MRFFLLIIISIKTLVFTLLAEPKYNFDVKPILSDRCYHCHGPDKETRKAKLRLDTEEGIKKALEGGELIARITSDDPEEIMPPPESKKVLSEKEKALISEWINAGGEYQDHWAFEKVKEFVPPKIENDIKVNNPIDAFIVDRLKETGLSPMDEASKEILIRRVKFDLTGLPPTKDEVDQFLAENKKVLFDKRPSIICFTIIFYS